MMMWEKPYPQKTGSLENKNVIHKVKSLTTELDSILFCVSFCLLHVMIEISAFVCQLLYLPICPFPYSASDFFTVHPLCSIADAIVSPSTVNKMKFQLTF